MITPSWVCKLGAIENVFGLMNTGLNRMASRAFKPGTLKIPKTSFSRIRGSNLQIARTMEVHSWIDDEASPTTAGNARTRGVNSSMVGRACPFPKSDDLRSTSDSTISLMTTKKGGAKVTLPRRFYRHLSQSFLNPIDIALQPTADWVAKGHRLATMQSLLRIISLPIQTIPRSARL